MGNNKRNRIIVLCVVLTLIIGYAAIYCYQYSRLIPKDVRYMENRGAFNYGGLDVELSARMYTPEEFEDRYREKLEKCDFVDMSEFYQYGRCYMLVVDRKLTRTSETFYPELHSVDKRKVYVRYYHTLFTEVISEAIQDEAAVSVADLEVGESTMIYDVFVIQDNVFSGKAINKVMKQSFYCEFLPYEDMPYLTRIKVWN